MADILFTNAAVQNRSYNLDDVPGKMAGVRAAQFLNQLVGNEDVVHAWNNAGLFDEFEQTDSAARLIEKYRSDTMQKHLTYWGAHPRLEIATDDAPAFGDWSIKVLETCLDIGAIYTESADFHVCRDCDLVIAETVVDVRSCGRCNGNDLCSASETALFVDTPEDRRSLLSSEDLFNTLNIRQEQAALQQVPPRLLLSRDRKNGVGLDDLDLPGKKLEPRLGIGLLALYAADVRGYTRGCLVQSTSTLVRTAPYIMSVIQNADELQVPRPLFAIHNKIDNHLLTNAGTPAVESEVFLPLASLRRKHAVGTRDIADLRSEFHKAAARVAATQLILDRLGLFDADASAKPEHMDQLIGEGRLNDFLPAVNRMLGQTIESMKRLNRSGVTNPDRHNADTIKPVLHLFRRLFFD